MISYNVKIICQRSFEYHKNVPQNKKRLLWQYFTERCPKIRKTHFKPAGLLQQIPVPLPFDRIGIDLLEPFRRSKNVNTMIIVATDYATRWTETKALTSEKAGPVAKFILENILTIHGSSRFMLSD